MKDLKTMEEFEKAPKEVQYLHIMRWMGNPVGSTTVEDAITKYPEYFPTTVADRAKWSVIPQSVHDAYWKEYGKYMDQQPEIPFKGLGIVYFAEHPEHYAEYLKAWGAWKENTRNKSKELYEKFYLKYGIEYSNKFL